MLALIETKVPISPALIQNGRWRLPTLPSLVQGGGDAAVRRPDLLRQPVELGQVSLPEVASPAATVPGRW